MIERVEVVKGPMSSLYGPEAMGGVIQIFTRGKAVPHLFIASAYGTDNDRRASAGVTTVDDGTEVALAAGVRAVDARSATNPRAGFLYNPDRDPYANAFFNARASQRLWQGETLSLEGFTTRSRTHFDSGPGDDRTEQQVSGAKLSSSTEFMPWWASRLWVGSGRDRLVAYGSFPSVFETQQDQASWINEFRSEQGTILLGAETNRQRIVTDANPPFAKTRRDIDSAFIALNEAVADQRVEASARHDRDAQFGGRNTGSVSYGWDIASLARLSGTAARGFRAPTFFDLYGPASDFYHPNPDLQPERSSSREITLQSAPAGAAQWKITAFDQRFDNLIVYSFTDLTVQNVARARSRGIEVSAEGRTFETRWRAAFTAQRARDEDTGLQLQGRAQRHGSVEVSRDFGKWTAGISVFASGQRFDSATESAASRLGGYAVVDARLRYAFDKRWSVELSAANLGDRRYESAVGYDAPRRTVLLNIRFESF
jgi:vitamin B12 transporter